MVALLLGSSKEAFRPYASLNGRARDSRPGLFSGPRCWQLSHGSLPRIGSPRVAMLANQAKYAQDALYRLNLEKESSSFVIGSPARWDLARWNLARWAPIPLRLIVGYGFFAHGYAKIARGPEVFVAIVQATPLQ